MKVALIDPTAKNLADALEKDWVVYWFRVHGWRHGYWPTPTALPLKTQPRALCSGMAIRGTSLSECAKLTQSALAVSHPTILEPVIYCERFGIYLQPDAVIDGHPVSITTAKFEYTSEGGLSKTYLVSESIELQLAGLVLGTTAHFVQLVSEEWSPALSAFDDDAKVVDAIAWNADVVQKGKEWNPKTHNSPLFAPNMNVVRGTEWDVSKRSLAHSRKELTLVWNISLAHRNEMLARGIGKWTDLYTARGHSILCRLVEGGRLRVMGSVLAANNPATAVLHTVSSEKRCSPRRMPPLPKARYVVALDFETFTNYQFPDEPTWVFLVGAYTVDTQTGTTETQQWVLRNLHPTDQRNLLNDVVDHIKENSIVLHWSNVERSLTEKWIGPQKVNWVDLLHYFRENAVGIRGAFKYNLKDVSNALKANGLIDCALWDSETIQTGLHAMREAMDYYTKAIDPSVMSAIKRYNLVDCDVLWHIYRFVQGRAGISYKSLGAPPLTQM